MATAPTNQSENNTLVTRLWI